MSLLLFLLLHSSSSISVQISPLQASDASASTIAEITPLVMTIGTSKPVVPSTKNRCNDRAWYSDHDYCDARVLPAALWRWETVWVLCLVALCVDGRRGE